MPRSKNKRSNVQRWVEFEEGFREALPHLGSFLADEEQFVELRFKVMEDGTTLAIAKSYGSDGTPMVCFGAGYGSCAAMLAIDRTIQGGAWRIDKPWQPKNEEE